MTVPTFILYSVTEPVFAHTEGGTRELLPGGNNITSLIEKWDSLDSLGVNVKEVERSVGVISSSRRASQELKNIQNIFEQNSQLVQPTDEHSFIHLQAYLQISRRGQLGKGQENSEVYKNTHLLELWV